jgi:hypothetical protein
MSKHFEGGCFCKSVRHRLASAPMFVHCCHCLNCQSQTGSAFVINALIETERCLIAVWSDYGHRRQLETRRDRRSSRV